MAGIFRSNLSDSTPMRRTLVSPFCTSPGQLQDVTMDNSYALGYRSPSVSLQQGSTSPLQGRSVREFEEQMASLRKENFNLKLRLYFIEENTPGYTHANSTDAQETIMKQLIDAKVEMEILRKEVQEKQDLLKDAAQAMTQMEKIQKETESRSQAIVEELNEKIHFMEMERDIEKSNTNSFMDKLVEGSDVSSNVNAIQKIRELEAVVSRAEEKEIELQNSIKTLERELSQRNEVVEECENKIKSLAFQNAEMLESLEIREKEVSTVERSLKSIRALNGELKEENEILNKSILSLREMSRRDTQNFDTHETTIRAQQDALNEMHAQLLREELQEIKRQLADKICMNEEAEQKIIERTRDHQKACKTIQKLVTHIQSLQNDDNKSKKNFEVSCETSTSTNDSIVQNLRAELVKAREDSERAENWRRKCANVCSCLSIRLKELAGFLDTLLKHKDVLGLLGINRRQQMREAVDYSLDLSKSLNMTLSEGCLSNLDLSLAQLSNLSEMFDISFCCKERLTFNSHEDFCAELKTNESLQTEFKDLKKELDKRRSNDQTKFNVSATKKERRSTKNVENHSESEAWSEPDRQVSLARIGLEELIDSGSKSSTCIKTSPGMIMKESISTDSSETTKHNRSTKSKSFETVANLEEIVKEKTNQMHKLQIQLLEADVRLQKESMIVSDMSREIEQLRSRNDELVIELKLISDNNHKLLSSKNDSNTNSTSNQNEIALQIEEKNQLIEKLKTEKDYIANEAQLAQDQICQLKKEINEIQTKHKLELSVIEEREQQKLDRLQIELTELMEKRISEIEEYHKNVLEEDWVTRALYNDTVRQLRKEITEAKNIIEDLNESETDLKKALIDSEQQLRTIKKNLDETTLQASKAVLDRTKAFNDKLQLETRLDELIVKIQHLEMEKTDFNKKIIMLEEKLATAHYRHQNSNNGAGYTSEEIPSHDNAASFGSGDQRLNNSSPDLGIESDAGRVSSVETANTHRVQIISNSLLPNAKKLSSKSTSNTSGDSAKLPLGESNNENTASASNIVHDCAKVEQENAELRRKLIRTKRAFEDTYNKLRIANQRKEQIEKDIKNQILKTHNVLKNARSNMEN